MRNQIMANFPVTIDDRNDATKEKIRKCMFFLKKDIVEDLITEIFANRLAYLIHYPHNMISSTFIWRYSKTRNSRYWSKLHDCLDDVLRHNTPIPEEYLRSDETLQKRTILL